MRYFRAKVTIPHLSSDNNREMGETPKDGAEARFVQIIAGT